MYDRFDKKPLLEYNTKDIALEMKRRVNSHKFTTKVVEQCKLINYIFN